MTLRHRILVIYSVTLCFSLLIVGFWSWFEFHEQRAIALRGDKQSVLEQSPVVEAIEIVLLGGLPAALLGLLVGRIMIQRALKPIRDLTEILEKTDASNLAEPVQGSGNGDELDRMSAVFNRMKERLGASFTQTREFTLHSSHELKTPLTIMHATLEQMLAELPAKSPLEDRVTSLLEEVQRLSAIVGQLAFLAKADAGLLEITRQPVALHTLVRDVTEDAVMLAAGASIRVELTHCDEAEVSGDRMRLRQLLLNLVDNAVKHNQPNGHVRISLKRDDGTISLEIANSGRPLSSEAMSRAFERFFRGDDSHNSDVEGSGLGLSIAQSIALAHGGELTMSAIDGETCVTLTLPSSSAAAS